MALSYSMHSNGHTTRREEVTSFCTSTSHSLWLYGLVMRKVSLSSAWSSHGIYFQPRDRSGYKELGMAIRLFASGFFLLLVCTGSTSDSTHLGLCHKSLKNFSLHLSFLPSSKEKVVVTIISCKIMTIFVDRSHFHQSKGLWSWQWEGSNWIHNIIAVN